MPVVRIYRLGYVGQQWRATTAVATTAVAATAVAAVVTCSGRRRMNVKRTLAAIRTSLEHEHLDAAAAETFRLLDYLLQAMFRTYLPRLDASEHTAVDAAVRAAGDGRPIEALTYGQLVRVCGETDFLRRCERVSGTQTCVGDLVDLRRTVGLRNRLAHPRDDGAAAMARPAVELLVNTAALLLDSFDLAAGGGAPSVASRDDVSDSDLVHLGIAVCRAIGAELATDAGREEAALFVKEGRPGEIVNLVDYLCNRVTKQAVASWVREHGVEVEIFGEDMGARPGKDAAAVALCIDSLDGTQHWIRRRNLYGTALSLFRREGADRAGPHRLRVSVVMDANSDIYFAREDARKAFRVGTPRPLAPAPAAATTPEAAHVCTVARRPDHFVVLGPRLARGSPFAGLYLFGGNPILASLAVGGYDAIFQPDASAIGDAQAIWDWLPGGHIAHRSGCTILSPDGRPLDVLDRAEAALRGEDPGCPYVAANTASLARAIAAWLGG